MKPVQKCPACGSERVWIWDAPEKKIECQVCKTVSTLHPTQAVPHWGPLPDIDAIAKAAHDAFWREITSGVAIAYEDRTDEFKHAWQAAATAAVKASNGEIMSRGDHESD